MQRRLWYNHGASAYVTRRDATSVLYVRRPTYFKYCNVSKDEAIPVMKFRSYHKWVSCVDLLLIILDHIGVETIANNLLLIKKEPDSTSTVFCTC